LIGFVELPLFLSGFARGGFRRPPSFQRFGGFALTNRRQRSISQLGCFSSAK
jgi:hypothetical protein